MTQAGPTDLWGFAGCRQCNERLGRLCPRNGGAHEEICSRKCTCIATGGGLGRDDRRSWSGIAVGAYVRSGVRGRRAVSRPTGCPCGRLRPRSHDRLWDGRSARTAGKARAPWGCTTRGPIFSQSRHRPIRMSSKRATRFHRASTGRRTTAWPTTRQRRSTSTHGFKRHTTGTSRSFETSRAGWSPNTTRMRAARRLRRRTCRR